MKQDMIAVLDLGSTKNTELARAIRALGVYSEIYPHDITAEDLEKSGNLKGLFYLEEKTGWWMEVLWKYARNCMIWAAR